MPYPDKKVFLSFFWAVYNMWNSSLSVYFEDQCLILLYKVLNKPGRFTYHKTEICNYSNNLLFRMRKCCPPGEDRKLWLDDLDPDDDEQQGADDEDNELQQSLQESVGKTIFTLHNLPQCVQQHGQGKLRVAFRIKARRKSWFNSVCAVVFYTLKSKLSCD